jgi:hypothetical protein
VSNNYLVISDLQIPAEHSKALQFCKQLKKEYKIPDENTLCVGDELDDMWAGQYTYDPNLLYGPSGELKLARERLRPWFDAFPKMRLAESNHGLRWLRRAAISGIPSELMRKYADIFGAPKGWRWARQWRIEAKHPFIMNHGMRYSGRTPYAMAPFLEGISVVFGHLHSSPGVAHIDTSERSLWGMCVGCLIDRNSAHFGYAKDNKYQPVIGTGVILNDGARPEFIPLDGI